MFPILIVLGNPFFIRNLLFIFQNQFLELSRIRCFKPHQLSRDGMIETEFESMQAKRPIGFTSSSP